MDYFYKILIILYNDLQHQYHHVPIQVQITLDTVSNSWSHCSDSDSGSDNSLSDAQQCNRYARWACHMIFASVYSGILYHKIYRWNIVTQNLLNVFFFLLRCSYIASLSDRFRPFCGPSSG